MCIGQSSNVYDCSPNKKEMGSPGEVGKCLGKWVNAWRSGGLLRKWGSPGEVGVAWESGDRLGK